MCWIRRKRIRTQTKLSRWIFEIVFVCNQIAIFSVLCCHLRLHREVEKRFDRTSETPCVSFDKKFFRIIPCFQWNSWEWIENGKPTASVRNSDSSPRPHHISDYHLLGQVGVNLSLEPLSLSSLSQERNRHNPHILVDPLNQRAGACARETEDGRSALPHFASTGFQTFQLVVKSKTFKHTFYSL